MGELIVFPGRKGGPEVKLVLEPEHDVEAHTFDEAGTPMLSWSQFRGCWVLWYLEPDGNGAEDYPIGGSKDDVHSALEEARQHLEQIRT